MTLQRNEPLNRITTGIQGFDEITGGGLLKSGVYILQGAPGAGKTILANQIAYRHAAGGGNVVYVTMLAESHARLFQHMQAFSFFDPALVPDKVFYISGFNALRAEGLPGVIKLLRSEMRAHKAGILVLDGLVMAASAAASDEALKLFVSDIQAHSTLTGCTSLLLTSDDADKPVSAEQTMVDGILLLRERPFGPRRERNIEVVKFRGSPTLRGNHAFRIGPDGIVIYPRLESMRPDLPMRGVLPEGVSTGIPQLDRMFSNGGFPKGGISAVSGCSGSGKTTLALHFAAQATPDERCLFFGFYESPAFLQQIAKVQGIDPRGVLSTEAVEYIWVPFGENVLDEIASRLLRRASDPKVTRVVIDGSGGFVGAPAWEDRGGAFLAALTNELRRLGVTTLLAIEEQEPGRPRRLDTATMSAVADLIVNLRITTKAEVHRLAWVGKSRNSKSDLRVRELVLGTSGIEVREPSPDVTL